MKYLICCYRECQYCLPTRPSFKGMFSVVNATRLTLGQLDEYLWSNTDVNCLSKCINASTTTAVMTTTKPLQMGALSLCNSLSQFLIRIWHAGYLVKRHKKTSTVIDDTLGITRPTAVMDCFMVNVMRIRMKSMLGLRLTLSDVCCRWNVELLWLTMKWMPMKTLSAMIVRYGKHRHLLCSASV